MIEAYSSIIFVGAICSRDANDSNYQCRQPTASTGLCISPTKFPLNMTALSIQPSALPTSYFPTRNPTRNPTKRKTSSKLPTQSSTTIPSHSHSNLPSRTPSHAPKSSKPTTRPPSRKPTIVPTRTRSPPKSSNPTTSPSLMPITETPVQSLPPVPTSSPIIVYKYWVLDDISSYLNCNSVCGKLSPNSGAYLVTCSADTVGPYAW